MKILQKIHPVPQMAEHFKNVLLEKGYQENQTERDSLFVWSNINENVNWTESEKEQNGKHIIAIENRFADKDERINRYLKLFSYKIKQQIQEEKESKEDQLSHNEILRILTFEKLLNDIAKIESYHIGNSDKLIILVSQVHGTKDKCQTVQDDIFEIYKRLIKNRICTTFGNEATTFKEMDDEKNLVFSNKYDTTGNNKYHFTTAWRLEKVFADKIFSSGLEDLVVKNEADIAMDNYFNKSNSKTVNSFQEKTLNARNEVFIKHATIIMTIVR